MAKRWGNALGGWKKQPRNKKGQFASKGGKAKSSAKKFSKKRGSSKSRSSKRSSRFLTNKNRRTIAYGVATVAAYGVGRSIGTNIGRTVDYHRTMNRLSSMQRQAAYLDSQINSALAGTSSPRVRAARRAGVAPMTGWNPGYKNGGKFPY